MITDVSCTFKLNAVIQLIDEHTNRPLIRMIPKIYTSSPVDIIRKDNGMYAFVNAKEKYFNVRVELPLYLPEEFTLSCDFNNRVKMIRCSPEPDSVLGAPPTAVTYFLGNGNPDKKIFLQCKIHNCQIRLKSLLENGHALFESTNFLYAGTGRYLLLKDEYEKKEIISTIIDKAYMPKRFFLSEYPLHNIKSKTKITIEPLFCTHTNKNGSFLFAVEDAEDGEGILCFPDGTQWKTFSYEANKRVIIN